MVVVYRGTVLSLFIFSLLKVNCWFLNRTFFLLSFVVLCTTDEQCRYSRAFNMSLFSYCTLHMQYIPLLLTVHSHVAYYTHAMSGYYL